MKGYLLEIFRWQNNAADCDNLSGIFSVVNCNV